MSIKRKNYKESAFTLVELLIGVAIVAILGMIALPNLNQFSVSMRVEAQINELHRLLLIARNTSVNTGRNVVICPIVSGSCSNDWTKEISVFVDENGDNDFDAATPDEAGEEIIRVKSAISTESDQLQYSGGNSLTYNSMGNLTNNAATTTFSYCPAGFTKESKGISVLPSGRAYVSQDINNDGFDQGRDESNITCT